MAVKKASKVDDFATKVADYPDDFIGCRDTGHHWKPLTATKEKDGSIRRVLSCANCNANRNQTLDKYGYILSSTYAYKSGYVIPGTGRLTASHRAMLRLSSITRKPIT